MAVALMGLALALRLHGIDWGLPQVYEEAYPLKKAWPMWGWGSAASFTLDPKFFNYPTFCFYLQFLGQVVLYGILTVTGRIGSPLDFQAMYNLDPTPFYLMGRGITTAFAVATVGVTFAIGRRVGGLGVATLAAFWVAVNGFHIAKSQAIEVDVPLTLFVMLTAWFALRIPDHPRLRYYLLAGLCAGLATSTKYSGGLLPLMILLAHFVALARLSGATPGQVPAPRSRPEPARRGRGRARRTAAEPAAGTSRSLADMSSPAARRLWRNLVLAGAVCAAALVLTSPYLVLDWESFQVGFKYERAHMREGHFGLGSTPAILWYGRVVTDQILGWPLAILAVVGLVWVVGVQKHAWAAILAIFPLVYVLILSSWSMKAARYILPVLPIACLMASFAVVQIVQRLRRAPAVVRTATMTLAAVLLAVPALAEYRDVLRRSRGDTRTLSRQWILDNVPAGALIVSEAYGPEPFNAIQLIDMPQELAEHVRTEHGDLALYGLWQIPMLQVRSELVAPFYELEQYVMADYLITSKSVRKRYMDEPKRYAPMVRFYEELDSKWPLVRTFGNKNVVGPEIRIYRNPQHESVLAERGQVRAPASLPRLDDSGVGLVAPHLQRLGVNLEAFNYFAAAAQAYELALTYPPMTPEVKRSCIVRGVRAHMRAGDQDLALRLLLAARDAAQSPQERAMWEQLRTTYFSEKPAPEATSDEPSAPRPPSP